MRNSDVFIVLALWVAVSLVVSILFGIAVQRMSAGKREPIDMLALGHTAATWVATILTVGLLATVVADNVSSL